MNESIRIRFSKSIELHVFIHKLCKFELDIEKTVYTNFYGIIVGWFTFDLHVDNK